MKYTLKPQTEMIHFLLAVERCKGDITLETHEGDMLNLKSQLSKYVFLATGYDPKHLSACTISCSEEDALLLKDYIFIL